jgi:hypothetical protein
MTRTMPSEIVKHEWLNLLKADQRQVRAFRLDVTRATSEARIRQCRHHDPTLDEAFLRKPEHDSEWKDFPMRAGLNEIVIDSENVPPETSAAAIPHATRAPPSANHEVMAVLVPALAEGARLR